MHKSQCISRNGKSCSYACKRYLWSCILKLRLGSHFWQQCGKRIWGTDDRESPHEPEFAYDNVRIHPLMINSNLVEYNNVGDTKSPLLRCFPLVSKLKGGDIITTGQYRNYQIRHSVTWSLDLCSKNLFIVYTSIWETHLILKYPFYLSVSLGLIWCLERCLTFISNKYGTTRWLLQDKKKFYTRERLEKRVEGDLRLSHNLLGELQFLLCVNLASQRQNA